MKKRKQQASKKNTTSVYMSELNNQATAGVPSEIQLLPAADFFSGFDGRVYKTPSKQFIANMSNAKLKYLPIDENHSIDRKGRFGDSSPAVGWMSDLYLKEDNTLWAKVEWTDRGKELIEKKEYKYISPVLNMLEDREVVSITRASLTNEPNLKLASLNSENNIKNKNKNKKTGVSMPELNSKIAKALGVSETATVDEAIVEINSIKAKSTIPDGYVKKEELNAEVSKREEAEKSLKEVNEKYSKTQSEALTVEVNSVLDKAVADGKIAPSTRKFYEDLCMKEGNTVSLNEFLKAAPKIISFEESKLDATKTTTELNAEESEWAKSLGYNIEEYKKLKEENK